MMSSHGQPDSSALVNGQLDLANPELPNEAEPVNLADAEYQNEPEPEILMRAILPENLNSRIAFNALMIKLLKMYIIIAHCPEFDPDKNNNDSGMIALAVNWFVTAAKDTSAKLGWGESSEAILNLCAELKRDIESAESFEAYFDLCNKLFKEANSAATKSTTPRRVPLFFAIISLIQQVMKVYYPGEYKKKLRITRARFKASEKKYTTIFRSPNSPIETEEYQHELMRELIILDDIENYHIIFRRGFNPFSKIFIPQASTGDSTCDYLSKPYLSEDEFSAMWSILDNQYQAEYGISLDREAMPYYQQPTKNYPLLLNPHFTMYYLFWLNKKTSMRDAVESAMIDYTAEDAKKSIKELFEHDRQKFIARTMAAEQPVKKVVPGPAKQGPSAPAVNAGVLKNSKDAQPTVKNVAVKDPALNNNNAVGSSKIPDANPIKTAAPKVVPLVDQQANAQKEAQPLSPPVKAAAPKKQSSTRITLAMNSKSVLPIQADSKKVSEDELPIIRKSAAAPAPSTVQHSTDEDHAFSAPDLMEEYEPDSNSGNTGKDSKDQIRLSGSELGLFADNQSDEDQANDNASGAIQRPVLRASSEDNL